MRKKLLTALPLAFLLLTACGEEEKQDDPQPAKTELITGKSWDLSQLSATKDGANYPGFNDNGTPDCRKDDLVKFNTDLTYVSDEGATKCQASDPQIALSGNWEFLNNETQLRVKIGSLTETYDIDALTGTELTITQAETRADGNYRFTYHYIAK